jgi:hypothetical protein
MRQLPGAGCVKREAGVSLLQNADRVQPALRLGKIEGTAMLSDDQASGIQQRGVPQKREYLLILMRGGVRWIEENNIEDGGIGVLLGGEFLQATKSIDGKHSRARTNFEQFQIFAKQLSRWAMVFDENYFSRAAAYGFDTDRAGPGKNVDEAAVRNAILKNVEERFAQAVAGRTKRQALQAFEVTAAKCSGDDAHERFSGAASADASEMIAPLPFRG